MERTIHNPWTWQEEYGFHQANEVTNPERTLYCSGQTAVDADGAAQHAGEMGAQVGLALDNLRTVLAAAGMTLADVMRLNIYVTDLDAFFEQFEVLAEQLGAGGCQHAGTLIEVSRLAMPGLMVELEATAVSG